MQIALRCFLHCIGCHHLCCLHLCSPSPKTLIVLRIDILHNLAIQTPEWKSWDHVIRPPSLFWNLLNWCDCQYIQHPPIYILSGMLMPFRSQIFLYTPHWFFLYLGRLLTTAGPHNRLNTIGFAWRPRSWHCIYWQMEVGMSLLGWYTIGDLRILMLQSEILHLEEHLCSVSGTVLLKNGYRLTRVR